MFSVEFHFMQIKSQARFACNKYLLNPRNIVIIPASLCNIRTDKKERHEYK